MTSKAIHGWLLTLALALVAGLTASATLTLILGPKVARIERDIQKDSKLRADRHNEISVQLDYLVGKNQNQDQKIAINGGAVRKAQQDIKALRDAIERIEEARLERDD